MTINLTWDLFIIVFFALIVAYSFIIGKHEAVKIIIATYVAMVAVQGLGNLLERMALGTPAILASMGLIMNGALIAMIKIGVFVTAIILISIRGGMEIEYEREPSTIVNTLLTGFFGFATAGLLLSTLTTYISGMPLLDASLADAPSLAPFLLQSRLLLVLVQFQDLWFALPAILLVVIGFISNE